jgi:hypothetical protein
MMSTVGNKAAKRQKRRRDGEGAAVMRVDTARAEEGANRAGVMQIK